MEELSADDLLLKAKCWREEAKRFAGRPVEARVCLQHAQDAETLAKGLQGAGLK
jgi:hypothetical protein